MHKDRQTTQNPCTRNDRFNPSHTPPLFSYLPYLQSEVSHVTLRSHNMICDILATKKRWVHTQKPTAAGKTRDNFTRDQPFIRRAGNLRSLSRVNHPCVSITWPGRVANAFPFKKKKKKRKRIFFPPPKIAYVRRCRASFNLHNSPPNLTARPCVLVQAEKGTRCR